MAMADDGGRWCPSQSPPASPANYKRRRFPDDVRSDASPERHKRHHRYADSAVEEGEVLGAGGAATAMDVDADSANRYSRGRHTERRSYYSRSHPSGSLRGRGESPERERQSGSSRRGDHARRRNSDTEDRHGRIDSSHEVRGRVSNSASHRDSATSSKCRSSDVYKVKPRSEEKDGHDISHKRQRSEEVKDKSASKVEEQGECQEKIVEPKIAVQENADEKFDMESRRTEAALPKSSDQQQMQKMQQVECVPCCNVDGHKTAHLKDNNEENSSVAKVGKPPTRIDILISTGALANETERPAVMICTQREMFTLTTGMMQAGTTLTGWGRFWVAGMRSQRHMGRVCSQESSGQQITKLGKVILRKLQLKLFATMIRCTGLVSKRLRSWKR